RRLEAARDVVREELADVADAERDHRHPIEAEAPGDHRRFDAMRRRHLRSEDPGAAELDPAEVRMLDVELDRGLGEGEIGGLELDLVGACDLDREELEEAEEVAEAR